MKFETIERCGRTHVVKNGVESAGFIERDDGGSWGHWDFVLVSVGSADEGIAAIANAMNTWYTATEAAEVLVEMGVFDKPPSAQRITKWCRDGLLPGAIKVRALRGSGGAWRIPEAGLQALANERRE